ncbi:MAG: hypothetical protein Q9181_002156 [Wetmoreana brouardii]
MILTEKDRDERGLGHGEAKEYLINSSYALPKGFGSKSILSGDRGGSSDDVIKKGEGNGALEMSAGGDDGNKITTSISLVAVTPEMFRMTKKKSFDRPSELQSAFRQCMCQKRSSESTPGHKKPIGQAWVSTPEGNENPS